MSRRVSHLAVSVLALGLVATQPGCSPDPAPGGTAATAAMPVVSPLPAEVTDALDHFRAEGPKGWAFTQTTKGRDKDTVERYDPRRRGPLRWTLLSDKGKTPTDEEQRRYRDTRPGFDSSSGLAAQVERDAAWLVSDDEQGKTYEFRLKPQGEKDVAAAHMRARFTFERASGAIVRVELFNFESFKGAASLTLHEARTVLAYTPPADGRPALPQEISMTVRGERFWFSDFEEKLVSTFSDFEDAAAQPSPEAEP